MPDHHRPIRSYVLRQGRITPAQQRAIETLGPQFCLPFCNTLLDFAAVFDRHAPTVLEIGFGMGETTARIAAAHPEHNFIALEVHSPGVGSLLQKIESAHLTNLRIIQHDAVEVVEHMIAPASLVGVHIFFPDPWPKKRHHKRRLLQAPLVHELALRLFDGGYFHFATDWAEYAEDVLATLSAEPLLKNSVVGFAPRPETRPQTKFEARGLRLGHEVFDLLFVRVSPDQAPEIRDTGSGI
ncbi:MAG: tRNA (guanosine(46)-N7)-methyltransferase TrmB [Proteobacteria bacterium]|nr:tRNA (guanosine(46)-N7)-methyltransferase TrmB [Pseudomonadota bacterium]MCL2309107.1 tRNA (guanosine(46)-N7)-methyltransferase TrmB [Pseudomonadota bacterium]